MSRWIRTAVVVVSVVVGAGACGGGGSTGTQSTPTPSTPTSTSTAANAALTAQQARTLAAAAILKTADMPGTRRSLPLTPRKMSTRRQWRGAASAPLIRNTG